LATVGLTGTAATAAPGDSWSTSFEAGDPAPQVSTEYAASPRDNVTGYPYVPGVVASDHITATASQQINAGEGATRAADGVPGTKWLTQATTGWLRFELA